MPSSRHSRSFSSLLAWSKHNSIPPPPPFLSDEEKFQRERRRELQFTLDKLEGRIRVTPDGRFRRVVPEDRASDDVCGLMSMLGNDFINTSDGVEENHFGNYHALSDWPMDESSSEFGGLAYDDSSFYGSNESDNVSWMTTKGVAEEVPRNITHPAFSWPPDTGERWDPETSSRVSEDSFFDGHTRCPPEPKLNVTCKAPGHLRYSLSPSVRMVSSINIS